MTEREAAEIRRDATMLRSAWGCTLGENLVLRRQREQFQARLAQAEVTSNRLVGCLLVGAGSAGLTLGVLTALLLVGAR